MIKMTDSADELRSVIDVKPDVYGEKIRAFAEGYGFGYYFCRFWVQDGAAAVCAYYSEAVVYAADFLTDEQAEELAAFLTGTGLHRILMPYELCERLKLTGRADKLDLMRWGNGIKNAVETDKESVKTDVSLVKIYEIAGSGFDIDFDKWYTDTSYMLRHGIAGVYMLQNSACAIKMYASEGIAYLSYVCTLPKMRGKGLSSRLLRYICAEEAQKGNTAYIICGDGLTGFYENTGFVHCGYAAQLDLNGEQE